jgi:hypothetical protein
MPRKMSEKSKGMRASVGHSNPGIVIGKVV